MKLNWGTAIVIAMISFMIFILTFVYRSVAMDEYKHELVSEDYYGDELHFQEEIDKLDNASKLKTNVGLSQSKDGLIIHFPSDLNADNIKGTVMLQRPSNKSLDLKTEIVLNGHDLLIPDQKLASGKYIVVVDWVHDSSEYMFKDEIFY